MPGQSLMQQEFARNRLLAMLDGKLQPDLEPFTLARGYVCAEANTPHEHVYFPTDGIISVLAVTTEQRRLEVGIYGREGFGPTSTVLGVDRSPHLHFVQVAGEGWRIPSQTLSRIAAQDASVRSVLLKFVQVFTTQTSYTAVSNGSNSIPERLARWLLMCCDRLGRNDLHLTHDFLGTMLAVRRSGVTEALNGLESLMAISNTRGQIRVLDRGRLEALAVGSYGVPEAEYRRLIGPL